VPYAEGRLIHDADSHAFEPPGWLDQYLDAESREKVATVIGPAKDEKSIRFTEQITARQRDPELRERDAGEILLRKGFDAPGAFIAEDRPAALDLLGFASQLVFTTAYLGPLLRLERTEEIELGYTFADAHNRAMVDFCAVDSRLLPVCYVPLSDIERSVTFTKETLGLGAAALMIASHCPRTHSPSHIGLDPVWAQAEEAGVPVVFHVGGGLPMDPTYKENGLPPVKDFTGGDGNFTSVSFMSIPTAPMQTLATMILDGVLERFPNLRIGVIEQGAAWVPGWMWSMDSAAEAFQKNEARLHKLSMRPSEYVQRQVRVTPYPHEPAGRIIELTGPDVCMFSSDYPHTEGGRNPLKRFDASLEGRSDGEKQRFYADNFVDMMRM
jgi:uncharacterized protein